MGLLNVKVATPPSPKLTTFSLEPIAGPKAFSGTPNEAKLLPSWVCEGSEILINPRVTSMPVAQAIMADESLWMAVVPGCPAGGGNCACDTFKVNVMAKEARIFVYTEKRESSPCAPSKGGIVNPMSLHGAVEFCGDLLNCSCSG